MNKKTVSIKKIPLEGLITILTDLYEKGVDYIDIHGEEFSSIKDNLHIYVNPAYYNTTSIDRSINSDDNCNVTLTDDEINSLM